MVHSVVKNTPPALAGVFHRQGGGAFFLRRVVRIAAWEIEKHRCLFLLVFVIEGQGLFIRGFFLVMGIIVLAGYLQFLKAIVRKRKKKP